MSSSTPAMMDVPDYAAGIRHKREAFRTNGIAAMFLYPADLAQPDWEERVYQRIMQAPESVPWRGVYYDDPAEYRG